MKRMMEKTAAVLAMVGALWGLLGSSSLAYYQTRIAVDTVQLQVIPRQYMRLTENTQVNMELTSDLYVDLNGYDLTGTILTNGYAVYGMDTATDGYTCENPGYFACQDAQGNPVVPMRHHKTSVDGNVKRYLTIQTENGYSFHRIYAGITHTSLRPAATGVGYKAVFCADAMVQERLEAFGYQLWLEGGKPIARGAGADSFVSGRLVTLLLKNVNPEHYGEEKVYATVWLRLTDGTVIESARYCLTLRQMLETINAQYTQYSHEQLEAVRAMLARYPITQSWNIPNLCR